MSIPLTDNTQDAKLQLCLVAADAAIKNYLKRSLETAVYTCFRFIGGGEAIVVPETPVLCYRLTGNLTINEPTVTGLPSTANLLVGMPVVPAPTAAGNSVLQVLPNNTTILSVDSASQVTLTQNATQSLSGAALTFGLALWFDAMGSFGDGLGSGTNSSGPFGTGTQLYPGLDYALQRDQSDGTSKCGKLIRLALGCSSGMAGFGGAWGGVGFGDGYGGLAGRGTLSANLPPLWPKYPPGSLKCVYAAGLGFGATAPNGTLPVGTTLPTDLQTATLALAAWMWRNADTGLLQVTSESFGGFSSSVATAVDALKSEDTLGSTRQILSRYRKTAI